MLVTHINSTKLFAGLEQAKGILLALSGGPDSVAALALLSDWAKANGSPPLQAATFDHGLRANSRAEAEQCAALCQSLGVAHQILTWTGDKPATRIQEVARDARYRALVAHAKDMGTDYLVTGHHADDQVETILFRMMRGSSIGGLAGMRQISARDGIIHARPLLTLRKSDLIAICTARGLTTIADPSNEDPRFARTQMRRLAGLLEDAGMTPDSFTRLAARAARADEALSAAAAQLASDALITRDATTTHLQGQLVLAASAEIALRLLMAEITRLGQAPRLEQAEPLADDLRAALSAHAPLRATLGGALVDLKRDSVLVITREPPRRAGPDADA